MFDKPNLYKRIQCKDHFEHLQISLGAVEPDIYILTIKEKVNTVIHFDLVDK